MVLLPLLEADVLHRSVHAFCLSLRGGGLQPGESMGTRIPFLLQTPLTLTGTPLDLLSMELNPRNLSSTGISQMTSMLWYASFHGNAQSVSMALAAGGDVSAQSKDQRMETALHFAAAGGYKDCVTMLRGCALPG